MGKLSNKLTSLKDLIQLQVTNVGDIYLYPQYNFGNLCGPEDKFFVVLFVDNTANEVVSFFVTSNYKYYKDYKTEGCYIKRYKPCYFIPQGSNVGFFKVNTYVQFDNQPTGVEELSELTDKVKKALVVKKHTIPDDELLSILKCLSNSDVIEPYYKKKLEPLIKDLAIKIHGSNEVN